MDYSELKSEARERLKSYIMANDFPVEFLDDLSLFLDAGSDQIETLQAENARLREALEYYAKAHKWPNDGPWGIDSKDFGDVARKALEGK